MPVLPDYAKLGVCSTHGGFVGKDCPKCYGKPVVKESLTTQPAPKPDKFTTQKEKEIHEDILKFCSLKGIIPYHSRMDEKSGLRKGAWDFALLFQGKGAAIECKVGSNKLSPEQQAFGKELERANVPHIVAYSSKEAIEFILKWIDHKSIS